MPFSRRDRHETMPTQSLPTFNLTITREEIRVGGELSVDAPFWIDELRMHSVAGNIVSLDSPQMHEHCSVVARRARKTIFGPRDHGTL